jgi:hypothetical protein
MTPNDELTEQIKRQQTENTDRTNFLGPAQQRGSLTAEPKTIAPIGTWQNPLQ